MRFRQILRLHENDVKEGTPETAVEYYWSEQENSIMVNLSKLSLLTVDKLKLKEFWDLRDEKDLINQFVKATMKIAARMGFESEGKTEYQKYKNLVEKMFKPRGGKLDITFFLEPGYNFKGLFDKDKFSISKVVYDEAELKQSKKEQEYEKKREQIKAGEKRIGSKIPVA